MISTEVLTVMFIFLVYVGIWMAYMNSFMGTVQNAVQELEHRSIADSIAHKANIACVSAGTESIGLGRNITVRAAGNKVIVGNAVKETDCYLGDYFLNASTLKIRKEGGMVVIMPA